MTQPREQIAAAIRNGEVTKTEARSKVDAAIAAETDRIMKWVKGILFLLACIAILLPSIGLTALLLAWAWTLIQG